jgi:hypothetical protein
LEAPLRILILVLALAACTKKAPEPAAAPPPPAPAPAPAPAPEPDVVADPAGTTPNASFTAAMTFANGEQVKDKVVRVERSEDWYGEKGWTDLSSKLTVTLEGDGTEVEMPWVEITRVDITYKEKPDIDCQYDSSYTPVMYMCVLPTTTKVKAKDGKVWDAASLHKWRFVFASGKTEEFWIKKLTAREQEAEVPSLGTVTENSELYVKLQDEIMQERAGRVPTSIMIFP